MVGFSDQIPKPVGWFTLEVWRRGILLERMNEPNAITIGYRDAAAAALGGLPNGAVTQIGFGTGAGAAAYGNTGLTTAFLKAVDSSALVGGNSGQITFNFSLASGDANGLSIAEFGLLTAAGVLVARKARLSAPILKDATISLAGTWTLSFVGP